MARLEKRQQKAQKKQERAAAAKNNPMGHDDDLAEPLPPLEDDELARE